MDWANLRGLTARQLTSALLQDGFHLKRYRGSHQRFKHPDGRAVTVSFHTSGETFPPGTLQKMIKDQAQWTEEDLKRLGLLK